MRTRLTGFTLVELLIIISIIAVLTSVIIPRLQSARDEGIETKIKTELTAVGKRASIEESKSLTYDVVCGTNGYTQATSITDLLTVIENFAGASTTCRGTTEEYAISIPVSSTTHWCVDSAGNRVERGTVLGVSEYSCQ